ncbi:hypothetical protein Pcinc_022419 [Petrolisthes cinctipes]|uniref:Uncharacterized protein n=1 Tax=Petrolisthes cinctipes TaxID=88211 RepID=A0AAE1KFZ4_PETCI|nr:hypothetical protein Pcinc_022419 [Petrolisthes cinctipes]
MASTSTSQVPVLLDLENRLQHGIFEQSLTCVASGIVNMMTPKEVQDSAKDRIFCRRLIIAMTRQKYTALSSELLSRRARLGNVLRVLGTEEREDLQQLMVKFQCRRRKLTSLFLRGAQNFWECKGDTQLYGEDWKDKTVSELYPTTHPDDIPEEQRIAPSLHSMRAKRRREYNLRRNESGGETSENSGECKRRENSEECKDQKVSGASSSKDVKDSADRRRKNKRTRDQEDDSQDNDRKKARIDNTNHEVYLCQNTKQINNNNNSSSSCITGGHMAGQNSADSRTPISTGPTDVILGEGMRTVQNATRNIRSMMEAEVEIEVPSTAWERSGNEGVEELFAPLFD